MQKNARVPPTTKLLPDTVTLNGCPATGVLLNEYELIVGGAGAAGTVNDPDRLDCPALVNK
jgi:hypothetical protein